MAKRADRGRSKAGAAKAGDKRSEAGIALYPSARPLPVEQPTKEVDIVELVSDDEWTVVLAYYEKLLPEQGWEEFASHRLEDRGTLSFRHPQQGTLTVLAAREADATHIRIYLKA